jgi:hypothetical protein
MKSTSSTFGDYLAVLLATDPYKPLISESELTAEHLLNRQIVLSCLYQPQSIFGSTILESVPIGDKDWMKRSILHYPSMNTRGTKLNVIA